MPDYLVMLIFMVAGAVICGVGVFLGGWINFKGSKASADGAQFIGSPKGEVFTVGTDGLDFPDEKPDEDQEHVVQRSIDFLKHIGGVGA
ncbi:MAG: hypothetical protein JRI22_19540 [Deltaproteobacteria bacterium]|nr:hypothetical protein [Deltaproteobacteria bacterium]